MRKDDGFGRVIDDQINAGSSLQRADIAPFTADDASLHVFAGQSHGGDGLFPHIVSGITLDGAGKDFLGLAICRFPCLAFDMTHHFAASCRVRASISSKRRFLASSAVSPETS